jgi:hypothetical protein
MPVSACNRCRLFFVTPLYSPGRCPECSGPFRKATTAEVLGWLKEKKRRADLANHTREVQEASRILVQQSEDQRRITREDRARRAGGKGYRETADANQERSSSLPEEVTRPRP